MTYGASILVVCYHSRVQLITIKEVIAKSSHSLSLSGKAANDLTICDMLNVTRTLQCREIQARSIGVNEEDSIM